MQAASPSEGRRIAGTAELTAFCLFFVTTMLILSLAGLAGHLGPHAAWIAVLIGLLVGYRAGRVAPPWRLDMMAFWLLLALPFVGLLLVIVPFPPYRYDELAYSAAYPKIYAAAHGIFYAPSLGAYSAFPSSYEALSTAALVATGSVAPVRLLGVIAYVATAAIATLLARMIGVSRWTSVMAGIFVLAAQVGGYSTWVKNDIVAAFLNGSTLLFLFAFLRSQRPIWLVFAGLALGVSIGTKYSNLEFALCVVVCALPLLPWRHRFGLDLRGIAWFGAASCVAASPWYIRNLVLFGNPLYPMMMSVFGDGSAHTAALAAQVHDAVYGIKGFSWRTGDLATFISIVGQEFGYPVLVLGLLGVPAFILRLGERPSVERWSGLYLALLTVVFTIMVLFFGFWAPRYFAVLLVGYAVFAALLLDVVLGFATRLRHLRVLKPVLPIGLSAALLIQAWQAQWQDESWMTIPIRNHSTALEFQVSFTAGGEIAKWINDNIPACARVAMASVSTFYYIDRDYYPLSVMGPEFATTQTADDFDREFQKIGLDYVIMHPWIAGNAYPEQDNPAMYRFIHALDAAADQLARDGKLEQIHSSPGMGTDVTYTVYKVLDRSSNAGCAQTP